MVGVGVGDEEAVQIRQAQAQGLEPLGNFPAGAFPEEPLASVYREVKKETTFFLCRN